MEPWIFDWLHLLTRWFHFGVGIAWIGASFYFVWLNNSIRPPAPGEDPTGRVAGGLWSVHGGAFYQVVKYAGTPEKMPEKLHWFKWEAYLTGLSGLALLAMVYWREPALMMVEANGPLQPWPAVGVGAGALLVGWLVYDTLCRSRLAERPRLLTAIIGVLLVLAAFGLSRVLSARAAFLHTGAIMGVIMAANVFFRIIPGQHLMVNAMMRGEAPDIRHGKAAALRSLHNNYFTFPVLFVMLSPHFPFTYGHPFGWAVLAGLSGVSVTVRHWMNLHEREVKAAWLLPVAGVALLGLALVSHGPKFGAASGLPAPPFAEVQRIVTARCTPCHAPKPTWPGIVATPKDMLLDTPERIKLQAALIHAQSVATQVMPLANLTGMTPEERATLDRWISAGAPLE